MILAARMEHIEKDCQWLTSYNSAKGNERSTHLRKEELFAQGAGLPVRVDCTALLRDKRGRVYDAMQLQ